MTLAAVTGLALVVAMAVRRLAEDDHRLTELAIRDPLTGAYNRRHFLAEATTAASRARRYGEEGAIAVIDLDHFKEINDQWGHATGDEALVRVHRALRTRLRSTDVLGRIGGDEFAAVILHVDADEALQVADELRDAVGVCRLGADRGRAAQPAGRVRRHRRARRRRGRESLVDLADQRMYDDKRGSAQ